MHPWNAPLLESLQQRSDRLPHALLLHGPQGTGKLALAERLVQTVLCEAPQLRPCGACEGCRWFLAGSHPDARRLEPEALGRDKAGEEEGEEIVSRRAKPSIDIKVEQVRELVDFLNVGSHRGRSRVALVHPAESMNANAANALLKGLEEPPPGAHFVLVSHRPARLLPTIRSRCIALAVALPPRDSALEWLAQQGLSAAERWLAYAGGAPLRALEYAAKAERVQRLLARPAPVDDREELEDLAEALQKLAIDRALGAFGLPPKYQTGASTAQPGQARAWLAYAREMGHRRALARHPLNPRLFSAETLAARPKG